MSAVLVAENARDAQLREGSIGYPGAVGQQMRRSRSISPHRDPDSAPIRVVSVQRSVFSSITRSFTKRVALEGSRPSGEICFGCSCVLQSVDSKRVRRTRGVGRTGDGGVFTTARCAPEGLARTHLRPLFAVCGNRQPATCSFAKPTTPRWSICSARSWRKAACASSELRRWRGTKTAAIKA